jgi:hypothetical protein
MRDWVRWGEAVALVAAVGGIAVLASQDDDDGTDAEVPEHLTGFVAGLDRLCAENYAVSDPLVLRLRQEDDLDAIAELRTEMLAADEEWLAAARELDVPAGGRAQVDEVFVAYEGWLAASAEAAEAAASGDRTAYDTAVEPLYAADAEVSDLLAAMGTSTCAQGSPGDRPDP